MGSVMVTGMSTRLTSTFMGRVWVRSAGSTEPNGSGFAGSTRGATCTSSMETWAEDETTPMQDKAIAKAMEVTGARRTKPDITLLSVQGGTDGEPSLVRGRDDPLRLQRRATRTSLPLIVPQPGGCGTKLFSGRVKGPFQARVRIDARRLKGASIHIAAHIEPRFRY